MSKSREQVEDNNQTATFHLWTMYKLGQKYLEDEDRYYNQLQDAKKLIAKYEEALEKIANLSSWSVADEASGIALKALDKV